jgi:hypothetical protein
MSWDTVDPNDRTLGEPVKAFLHRRHGKVIKINEEIESSLSWRPTLHFEAREYSIIAADVKMTPFPESLMLTKTKIANAHLPITIYSICSENAFLTKEGQKEASELKAHGLGLFTVDADGVATKQFGGIPIINHIPLAEFDACLVGIPKGIATRIKDAFDSYNNTPTDGVTAISDVLEGLVYDAIGRAIKKGWMTKKSEEKLLAAALDDMVKTTQFATSAAAIGGVRGFVKSYRNTANHNPRSRKAAYDKYVKCKQAFFAGMHAIDSFYRAMKDVGIKLK